MRKQHFAQDSEGRFEEHSARCVVQTKGRQSAPASWCTSIETPTPVCGRRAKRVPVLSMVLLLIAGIAGAQPPVGTANSAAEARSAQRARAAEPYSGVVVNNTMTFIGQEFYSTFVTTWREASGAGPFSVSVHERPSARWGSLVWIEYEHRELFRAFLSPGRRDFVRQAGADAARIVHQRAIEVEAQRLLFRDPDLARDEI